MTSPAVASNHNHHHARSTNSMQNENNIKISSPSRRERSRSTASSPSKNNSVSPSNRGRRLNDRRALAMTAAKLMNEEAKQQRSSSSGYNARTLDSLSYVSAGTNLQHGNGSSTSPGKRSRRHRNSSDPSLASTAECTTSSSKSTSIASGGGSPRRSGGIRKCHSTFGTKQEETSLRERMEQRLNIGGARTTNAIIKQSASMTSVSSSSRPRKDNDQSIDAKLRYDHYKRLNRLGTLPHQVPRSRVKLNIYDLLENDALLDVEGTWCNVQFPIGACFKHMNDGLHFLGTGAYHVGIEVDGVEYAFGAHNMKNMTGVFTCRPKQSPGFSYRTTIDFGQIEIKKKVQLEVPAEKQGLLTHQSSNRQLEIYVNAKEILQKLSLTYLGTDYNLLRKNCCTFARDALLELGIEAEDIPSWFTNISEAGAMTEDVVTSVDETLIMPIRQMFSESEEDPDCNFYGDSVPTSPDVASEDAQGFEVELGQRKITEVNIVNGEDMAQSITTTYAMKKTPSWTY